MSEPKWAQYNDDELLKTRICDLGLQIAGTDLEGSIQQLYNELGQKGLLFHPPCYLADEWLCPDQEPIIGIPFYLAHPRLKKLEMKMVLEVEGETKDECMKLLRHEAGHAYNYAYKLYRRRAWGQLFGPFSEEYPETYIPQPYSRKYVRHLKNCYAQYHPDEDFAETFAVWLTPDSNWKEEYKKWKAALTKLEYVNDVMDGIREKQPVYTCKKRYWSADKLKQTLEFYYRKKRREYAEDLPGFYDPDLRRIFRGSDSDKKGERADRFIRRHRLAIVNSIGMWTGKNRYVINRIVKELMEISAELGLYCTDQEDGTLLELTSYINTMVMNYLFTGRLKQFP